MIRELDVFFTYLYFDGSFFTRQIADRTPAQFLDQITYVALDSDFGRRCLSARSTIRDLSTAMTSTITTMLLLLLLMFFRSTTRLRV